VAARRELIINGLPLANDAIGIGAYGTRIARGLLERRAELRFTPVIAAPSWIASRLDFGAYARPLGSPRAGHELLDQILWSVRLGAYARKRNAVLFSPSPFWSPVAPADAVVCHHDRIYHHFPRYLGRKFIRKFLAYRAEAFLRRSRIIVTESDFARADLAKIYGVKSEKISVIRAWLPEKFNPRNSSGLAPAVREKYGLPERFWLYVGGYDYRKNVELLVAAYARIAGGPDMPRLVLAGKIPKKNGPYCDVAGAIRTAKLPAEMIALPGFIDGADMPGLYGAAELFIYPSRCEGFGLPPMEAMGCGCPAICADSSSLPEVVCDAGYRFADDDVAMLASMLARAVKQRMPLNPSFDRSAFDEGAAISEYIKLFNKLADA
jgi:glycosyltransferase involved in cell wall biosynthesis